MGEIGYVAANVSERDLLSGYDPFLERRKEAKFPFVSANLVFQSNGRPIVEPYTIVTFEPKKYPALKTTLRVAITGITRFNPTFLKSAPPKDNVVISNPSDELKKYIPEMRKKADEVIVLAAMPRDDAHLVAKDVPGIDLVIGASGGMITGTDDKEGTTSILYIGNQGKYLEELRLLKNQGLVELKHNLHYLNATYPEDPGMKAKVDAALAEINSAGKVAAVQASTPAAGSMAAAEPPATEMVYLTSEACKDCHATEYQLWRRSKHSLAMQTLVDAKADFNSECVGCHTVGFKKKGGFIDGKQTPTLVNVQCESCHGPAARHIKNPNAPYGKAGPLSCVNCHNHERSPSFEFNAYWTKIKHGA